LGPDHQPASQTVIPGKQYTPEDFVWMAWRRKWWALIPAVLIAAAVMMYVRTLPNRYQSDTLILVVPQRISESYVRSLASASIGDRLQSISQQIMSRTRLERIIQDFNLYTVERRTAIMEDVVERMRGDILVQVVKGDAFRVGFSSDEPRTAMRVAERLASLFIEENLRDREVLAEGTNQFLEAQLEEARRRLIDTEKRVQDYRREHLAELPEQVQANMQGQHNVEVQLQSILESLNRDKDRRLALERITADMETGDAPLPAIAPAQQAATNADGIPVGASAAQQLVAAQDALQAMQLRLTPEHPDVARLKRIIAELQKKADAEAIARPVSVDPRETPAEALRRNRKTELKSEMEKLDRQITAKLAEEKRLRDVMSVYQKRIETAPTRDSELTELTRDYGTLQTMYKSLLAKREDSKVSANLERRQIGEQFKILDAARLPQKPTSPNRPRLYGVGIAGGLALGIALAALIEYLDKTLRSESDIKAALNLLVLATVPILPDANRSRTKRWAMVAVTAALFLVGVLGAAVVVWKRWG
jgi:polysaccharide chain length determinant protein (PEP-CTERM system associated)